MKKVLDRDMEGDVYCGVKGKEREMKDGKMDTFEERLEKVKVASEPKSLVAKAKTRNEKGQFVLGGGKKAEKDQTVILLKYENFCQEFMRDYDQARAAKASGFAPGSSRALMRDERIRVRLKELQAEKTKRFEGELPEAIEHLKKMAFAKPSDYFSVGEDGKTRVIPFELLTEDQKAAIAEVTIEGDNVVKMKISKSDPLTKLIQHYGGFPTRVEFTGKMMVANIDLTKLPAEEVAKIARDPRVALKSGQGS